MDCSLPGSSVHGISQARILEWVVIPFSRGSGLTALKLAGGFFTPEPVGRPLINVYPRLKPQIEYRTTPTSYLQKTSIALSWTSEVRKTLLSLPFFFYWLIAGPHGQLHSLGILSIQAWAKAISYEDNSNSEKGRMRLLTCKDSSGVTILSEGKVLNDATLCTVPPIMAEMQLGWRGAGDLRRRKIWVPAPLPHRQECAGFPRPTHTINCYHWHHRLSGHASEQTPRDGEGQGTLACCSRWGHKESDTTDRLNNNNKKVGLIYLSSLLVSPRSLWKESFRQQWDCIQTQEDDWGKSQTTLLRSGCQVPV